MESCARICGCWWAGKTSMMRVIVEEAELVCSVAKALHHRGQPKRIESLDVPRNGAEHGADGAALIEAVSAKTRQALQAKRKVQLQVFFEAVLLRVGQHAVGQGLGIRGGERRHVQRTKFSMHANPRGAIGSDMEVAPPHLNHLLQQLTERNPSHPSSSIL